MVMHHTVMLTMWFWSWLLWMTKVWHSYFPRCPLTGDTRVVVELSASLQGVVTGVIAWPLKIPAAGAVFQRPNWENPVLYGEQLCSSGPAYADLLAPWRSFQGLHESGLKSCTKWHPFLKLTPWQKVSVQDWWQDFFLTSDHPLPVTSQLIVQRSIIRRVNRRNYPEIPGNGCSSQKQSWIAVHHGWYQPCLLPLLCHFHPLNLHMKGRPAHSHVVGHQWLKIEL